MSRSNITEITDVNTFKVSDLVFSKPAIGNVPGTTPQLSYKRINIGRTYYNSDGSVRGTGEMIMCTPRSFSWGVSQNIDPKTQRVNGFVMSICLWTKGNPTPEERLFTTTLEKIIEHCKEYLLEHKADDDMKLYELEMADMKKFAPLVWKKEMGKIVEGTGPTLYVKLIESKKNEKILSQFYDMDGHDLNYETLIGKYCHGNFAIKIESIFIGTKPTLQIKLYEAQVEPQDGGMKRLLSGQPATTFNKSAPTSTHHSSPSPVLDETSSLKGDDDYDQEQDLGPSVPPTKMVATAPTATTTKAVKTVKRVKQRADE